MGDMGDYFRDIKEATKERRRERYKEVCEQADMSIFVKHTPYHWQTKIDGVTLDYWPSAGKWGFKGLITHGDYASLMRFIANRKPQ